MIAGGPIAGHPIAAPLLRRIGAAVVETTRGAWGSGSSARIRQEDEEIMAVIMAFTQRGGFPRNGE